MSPDRGNVESVITKIMEECGRDPLRLMDIVRNVQTRLSIISEDSIDLIAQELGIHRVQVTDMISFYTFFKQQSKGDYTIRLSNSVVDKMNGLADVAIEFEKRLGISVGETTADGRISLEYISDIGMGDQAPAALINDLVVTQIAPEDVPAIIDTIQKDEKATASGFPDSSLGTSLGKTRELRVDLNLRKRGPVIFDPVEQGAAIRRALNMTPEQVIDEIMKSRLRGRGGAGFPTGMKWSFCRKAVGDKRYIICNADEGEPGTFKDRVILTEAADNLIEGMTIGGYALGAELGLLYLRAEYLYLWGHLEHVLAKRRRIGLLGKNVGGRQGFNFDVRIQIGAGAYICGEESALIESLEGKRGAPRDRPPFPVQRGYVNQPSAVNNVETLCCVAKIFEKDGEWFAQIGTRDSSGTKLLSISGDCPRPGVYEVEYGIAIEEVLEMLGAEEAQAVQVGGPSGRCVAPKDFGRRICFEDTPTGGSFIVFSLDRDLVQVARDFTEFFVEESCGWCAPCRVGTIILLHKMEKIIEGKGTAADLDDLEKWGKTVTTMSRCGLGQTAANPILTTLKNFRHLFKKRISKEEFRPTFDLQKALQESYEITGRRSSS